MKLQEYQFVDQTCAYKKNAEGDVMAMH